jgi:N6-adenosine-specific RNA methylase IME4
VVASGTKESTMKLPPTHPFAGLQAHKARVIVADPPWSFETWSDKGKGRSADRHYRVSTLDDIKALPVRDLAAKDCALFLWTTWPNLFAAREVLEAWGFRYRTLGFIWVKQTRSGAGLHTGCGYWTRSNSEPCLLAARGKRQRRSRKVHSVIMSPVREHSRKPDETYNRIERLLAGLRIELWARQSERRGWSYWGDEIERFNK